MPPTWAAYGVDANGDGVKDPNDPWDAIFAATRYLSASGAPENWHDAIFAYNHAEWYVERVQRAAERFGGATAGSNDYAGAICAAGIPAGAVLDQSVRLFAPRAFKVLPARFWVGGGAPQAVDARIWPNAVWLLESFDLRVTAAREPGHQTHGDGTALDIVPALGRGWDEMAMRARSPSAGNRAAVPAGLLPSAR